MRADAMITKVEQVEKKSIFVRTHRPDAPIHYDVEARISGAFGEALCGVLGYRWFPQDTNERVRYCLRCKELLHRQEGT